MREGHVLTSLYYLSVGLFASAGAERPREPLTSAREGTLEVFSLRECIKNLA